MIIAVWVNWQCTVIRGRLQGLMADRTRRSKGGRAGQHWKKRLHKKETFKH